MKDLILSIPTFTLLLTSATLGLAPFVPAPHVWEKIIMLLSGDLTRPIDIFDFAFHGLPWALLIAKLVLMRTKT